MQVNRVYIALTLALLGASAVQIQAQTYRDPIEKATRLSADSSAKYIRNGSISFNWNKDGRFVSYQSQSGVKKGLYAVDLQKGKKIFICTDQDIKEGLMRSGVDGNTLKTWSMYQYEVINAYTISFEWKGQLYHYNANSKTATLAAKPKKENSTQRSIVRSTKPYWQKYSSDSLYYIYAYNDNLYLAKATDTLGHALTTDAAPYFSFSSGNNNKEHTAVSTHAVWVGRTDRIFSIREDRRMVPEMSIVNNTVEPYPQVRTYKFPLPGDKKTSVFEMQIWDVASGQSSLVELSKYADQRLIMPMQLVNGRVYLYAPRAGEDDRYVYFLRRNRANDRVDLCRLDIQSAEVKELISEKITPHINEQLFSVHILNQGKDILWWSERSGFGQYYLYDANGKLRNQIGQKGDYVAANIVHIAEKSGWMVYETYGYQKGQNPYYKQYAYADFSGKNFRILTPENAQHDLSLSPDKKYFINRYSRIDQPSMYRLGAVQANWNLLVDSADITALLAQGWKAPEQVKFMAADGITPLYGLIYKPFNLDPNKKYPVISSVYPGPQDDYIPQGFVVDDNYHQTLAELGFIVVQIPSRGSSPYRGLHFHTFGYGNLRDYPLADNKLGIETVAATRPYMDLNRVGIFGHSGGGFMSATALLTYPEFYKVAVAASGNYDPNIYTQWWSETYHGLADSTQLGKAYIPTTGELAKNLQGKLLLITGDVDNNVHPAHTMRLAKDLISANKYFDMMILPGRDHGLGDAYYQNLIRQYFLKNLN